MKTLSKYLLLCALVFVYHAHAQDGTQLPNLQVTGTTQLLGQQTYVQGALIVGANANTGDFDQFTDTFDGTTINTNNWTVTGGPNQNGGITFGGGDSITSKQSYRRNNSVVLTFDASWTDNSIYGAIAGFGGNAFYWGGGNLFILQNGSIVGGTPIAGINGISSATFKIVINPTGAVYFWSFDRGNTWAKLYDGTADNIIGASLNILFSGASTGPFTINNVSVDNGNDVLSPSKFSANNLTVGNNLDVIGGIRLTSSGAGLTFPDGSTQTTANTNIYTVSGTGYVGIGTPDPQSALEVSSFSGTAVGITLHNQYGEPQSESVTQILFEGGSSGDGAGIQPFGMIQSAGTDWDSSNGFLGFQTSQSGQLAERMRIMPTGNVGIGTTSPSSRLEVNGNVKLTQGSGASITFPDNTVQSTAWNGTTLGGDYAESVDVQGDRAAYEPGDVIVIDDAEAGKFNKSDRAYSKMVAGVFSTKPGLVGRRTTAERPAKDAEIPMAMMGIVPTKVSTENGPIEKGDLLVSSSTPGYAMKGTERDRLTGAIIGKALAPLKSGSGVIEVLLAIQ